MPERDPALFPLMLLPGSEAWAWRRGPGSGAVRVRRSGQICPPEAGGG